MLDLYVWLACQLGLGCTQVETKVCWDCKRIGFMFVELVTKLGCNFVALASWDLVRS